MQVCVRTKPCVTRHLGSPIQVKQAKTC
uniref:Uncharacterized protein n=1 Tax=Anguilla anguilla TaxID=7936 RepID=A0A0E9VZ20_ANGAN